MKTTHPHAVDLVLRRVGLAIASMLACACSSASRASEPPRRVPASELPAAQRDAWVAYHAGGARWEVARAKALEDPAVTRFVVDNLVVEMVRAYERSAIAKPGERAGPFERAQSELVTLASESAPVLAELMRVGDGIVAFLAADTLERIGEPAIAPTLAQVDGESGPARRRAIELLAALPRASDDARESEVLGRLAARLRTDSEWIVRAEAARTIGARGARLERKDEPRRTLLQALADRDPAVAEMACRGLELLGDPRAIPGVAEALQRFGDQGQVKCVRAAERALATLSRTDARKKPAEWRAWWDAHQAELVGPRAPDVR